MPFIRRGAPDADAAEKHFSFLQSGHPPCGSLPCQTRQAMERPRIVGSRVFAFGFRQKVEKSAMKDYIQPMLQVQGLVLAEDVIRTSAIELLPSGIDEDMEADW